MEHVLLSIKPGYAYLILDGEKTVEIRTRRPRFNPGTTLFLYASSPEQAVVGAVTVQNVMWATPKIIWRHCAGRIGVSKN